MEKRASRTAFALMMVWVAAILLLVLPFWVAGDSASAQDEEGSFLTVDFEPSPKKPDPRFERMDSSLAQLVLAWQEKRLAQFSTERAIDILAQEKVRVIVEVPPEQADAAKRLVGGLGGQVELEHKGLVQALVPVPVLGELAQAREVRWVRLPYPVTLLVVSEGIAVINANDWHSQGWYGNGIKVGVLDIGFSGYESLLGTELPSTVTTWWAPSIGGPGSDVHGTACAEIVYDVAPAAALFLANCNTDVEWNSAVDWLIGQGVHVVSHSLGWLYTGPGDGTGPIGDGVRRAGEAGIVWSQSAGNNARTHWSGPWQDPDGNGWLNFSGTDETNRIYAEAGDLVTVGLRWNDPWGGSTNDYDLYLYDDQGRLVALSTNWQTGTQNPREFLTYSVSQTGYYHIMVKRYNADGTATFDLMTFKHDLQYQVAAGSLLEPADSPYAITVGAVPWHDPNTLEPFSSQGPTTDGRIKPDLVAPDGVSTVSYGAQNFYGTSAAAPHGAGAAALVRQRFPGYSRIQIQSYLETNAVDLGPSGKDNQYGSGRLYLPAGTAAVFRVERGTGNVYADGAFYGKGFYSGSADIAEWVPVSEPVEPGDVLELDPTRPGFYRLARGPCSQLVAGVVSTEPGFVLGSPPTTSEVLRSTFDVQEAGQALLALIGIVPVKVTDENGPIRVGDLLVVSSTPGYAMRWDHESGPPCILVGKALEHHGGGTGVIPVLLMR